MQVANAFSTHGCACAFAFHSHAAENLFDTRCRADIESQHLGATTILRHATSDDIPAILFLAREAMPAAHWSELSYRSIFEPGSPFRIAMVVRADGRDNEGPLQAFLFARFSGSDCELENMVVAPENQRCGLGSILIHALIAEACEHKATRIFLEVRESNTAARRLYEKCGLAITSRRKSYYVNPPEDAVR